MRRTARACTKGITPMTSNPATRNPIPMYMIGSIMTLLSRLSPLVSCNNAHWIETSLPLQWPQTGFGLRPNDMPERLWRTLERKRRLSPTSAELGRDLNGCTPAPFPSLSHHCASRFDRPARRPAPAERPQHPRVPAKSAELRTAVAVAIRPILLIGVPRWPLPAVQLGAVQLVPIRIAVS